jgi:hypothetical protein
MSCEDAGAEHHRLETARENAKRARKAAAMRRWRAGMKTILSIDGNARESNVSSVSLALAMLKRLVGEIESGKLQPENMFVIATVPNKTDPRKVTNPTWDTDMTVSETVFLLEIVKNDIFDRLKA